MLVLTRRKGVCFVIGDDTVVTVSEITDEYTDVTLTTPRGASLGEMRIPLGGDARLTYDVRAVMLWVGRDRVRFRLEFPDDGETVFCPVS